MHKNLALTQKFAPKTKTDTKTDSSERILQLIEAKPTITIEELMKEMEFSKSGVRYTLNKLRSSDAVKRIGGRKNGRWVILPNQATDSAKGKKRRQ